MAPLCPSASSENRTQPFKPLTPFKTLHQRHLRFFFLLICEVLGGFLGGFSFLFSFSPRVKTSSTFFVLSGGNVTQLQTDEESSLPVRRSTEWTQPRNTRALGERRALSAALKTECSNKKMVRQETITIQFSFPDRRRWPFNLWAPLLPVRAG